MGAHWSAGGLAARHTLNSSAGSALRSGYAQRPGGRCAAASVMPCTLTCIHVLITWCGRCPACALREEAQLARYTCAAHPLCTRLGTRRRCASVRRAKARAATRANLRARSSPQDGESALPSRLSRCSAYCANKHNDVLSRRVCGPLHAVRGAHEARGHGSRKA